MTAITKITSIALDETGNYTVNDITVSSNVTSGNANLGNAATANFFIGNGSLLTGLPASYSNTNVAAYLPTYTGNISAGNANLGNAATANFFIGNGSLLTGITATVAQTVSNNAQPNITSTGTLSSLTVSGLITATGTGVRTSNIFDSTSTLTIQTRYNNIAGDAGIYGNLTVGTSGTGNLTAFNANLGNLVIGNFIQGTLTTGIQSNITRVGTLSNLTVSGNVSLTGSNIFISNVNNLKIPGGNANFVLSTDGTGNLSWTAQSGGGGGTPGGSNTQLQFNSNGTFGGTTGLTFISDSNRLSITNYSLVTNVLGNVSGNVTINLNIGSYITANVVGPVIWTFANAAPSPNASGFVLELFNGGSNAQIWPTSVKWPGGVAPTLTGSGVDLLTFVTDDAGVNWRGVATMIDSK